MSVTFVHFIRKQVPYDLVNSYMKFMPGYETQNKYILNQSIITFNIKFYSETTFWQLIACTLVSLTYWIIICLLMRYLLKILLIYKGWMYEARGSGSKPSILTTIWFVLVKGKN